MCIEGLASDTEAESVPDQRGWQSADINKATIGRSPGATRRAAIRNSQDISTVLVMVAVLMEALSALEAAGVAVRVERERHVHDRRIDAVLDLTLGTVHAKFAVEERRRSPYPNELPKLEPMRKSLTEVGAPMLLVPFVSEALGTSLTQAGWSWADAAGNFDLRSDQLVLRQRSTATPPRTKASRLPQGAIVHVLAARGLNK